MVLTLDIQSMTSAQVTELRKQLDEGGQSICGRCRRVKSKSEFNKDSNIWNGITNRCTRCTIELNRRKK